MHRRDFIKLMGIATGGSLVSSCGFRKPEKLIPYLVPPEEEIVPGIAVYYKTTCSECPAACGLTAKVHDKVHANAHKLFPTKLEGVAGHPINDGTLCMRGQASLTRLYHPDRMTTPLLRNKQGGFAPIGWSAAIERIVNEVEQAGGANKQNVFLCGRTTGTLSELIDQFCKRLAVERLPEYEVFGHSAVRKANDVLFGHRDLPGYHIEKADFLLTFGADLLETFVSPVSYTAQISRMKKQGKLHWIHLEPHVSLTGLQANQRLVIRPGSEAYIIAFLVHQVVDRRLQKRQLPVGVLDSIPRFSAQAVAEKTGLDEAQLDLLLDELVKASSPLLIVGGAATDHTSGLQVALFAGMLQWILGMTESTVDFSAGQNYANVGSMADMQKFSNRLQKKEIGVLIIADTNPVKTLPTTLAFKSAFAGATFRVGISDLLTDTVKECDLILPLSHSLESWGDAEPYRGLRTVIQPVLEPLYETNSVGDILLMLMAKKSNQSSDRTFQEYLFKRWKEQYSETQIDEFLTKGYLRTPVAKDKVVLNERNLQNAVKDFRAAEEPSAPVLVLTPSIRSFDGRSRALPMLQEIPDPLTTISYGQWISISPETASRMELRDRDEVAVSAGDWSHRLPVRIQPGLHAEVSMIQRDLLESIPGKIDPASGEHIGLLSAITLAKTGQIVAIPILSGAPNPLGDSHEREHSGHEHQKPAQMYQPHVHKEYRWGMAIDLNVCSGCSACVAACYVENNVPLTGLNEHLKGRELSWIRIQPEYAEEDRPTFLPMLCQHCDNAPCEPVCPTFAAYHTPEGLNAQIYNRCVGTRYCSNNCPYKVRRFNWFDYSRPEPVKLMFNPDVSVRGRGVMEKCTFCVQRIRAGKDHAKDEGRLVKDGEVVPACAQSCPSQAIVFGNLLDPGSRVAKMALNERSSRVLEELNTQPAVHYLKKSSENPPEDKSSG
jgi:Fe-S-cluster-containing dehydrogenase component/anaerobic selenocysteine-containing dehydrogenase